MAGENIYISQYFTVEEVDQQLLKVNTDIKAGTIDIGSTDSTVQISYNDNKNKKYTVNIPAATIEKAGVLTPEDKRKLEDTKKYKDALEGAIEGGYEDIAYLIGMKPDGSFVKISPEVLLSSKTKYISQEEYDDLRMSNKLDNNIEYNIFEDE